MGANSRRREEADSARRNPIQFLVTDGRTPQASPIPSFVDMAQRIRSRFNARKSGDFLRSQFL